MTLSPAEYAQSSLSGIVNSTSGSLISPKHSDGFLSAEISGCGNPTFLQLRDPIFGFGSFVEPDRGCIGSSRAANDFLDTGPNDGAVTHGAGFTTRNQFERRHAVAPQIELSQGLVCIRERHHLSVGEGTVGGFHDIYPDSDWSACVRLKYGSSEWPTGSSGDVREGELDHESHAFSSRCKRHLPAARDADSPRWKAKEKAGRETRPHDGSDCFNASRFLVTMASPFFVDTSIPMAQTVRHSSRPPSLWSD